MVLGGSVYAFLHMHRVVRMRGTNKEGGDEREERRRMRKKRRRRIYMKKRQKEKFWIKSIARWAVKKCPFDSREGPMSWRQEAGEDVLQSLAKKKRKADALEELGNDSARERGVGRSRRRRGFRRE